MFMFRLNKCKNHALLVGAQVLIEGRARAAARDLHSAAFLGLPGVAVGIENPERQSVQSNISPTCHTRENVPATESNQNTFQGNKD